MSKPICEDSKISSYFFHFFRYASRQFMNTCTSDTCANINMTVCKAGAAA